MPLDFVGARTSFDSMSNERGKNRRGTQAQSSRREEFLSCLPVEALSR
jgi:hypothetical protein